MDRTKLMEAVAGKFLSHQKGTIFALLKNMSDANLVVFANQMGIDTDTLISEGACL